MAIFNTIYISSSEPVVKYEWWSPKMTSNTTPTPFIASASSIYGNGFPAYRAFDGISTNPLGTDTWASANNPPVDTWLKIDFGNLKTIKGVRLQNRLFTTDNAMRQFPKTVYVEISNDDQTWETIYTEEDIPMQTVPGVWVIETEFDKEISSRYVRFSNLAMGGTYAGLVSIANVEFYIAKAS